MADRLGEVLDRRRIEEAYFAMDALRPFARCLSGRRVESVQARGKALLVHFELGLTLYTHNQLYGTWRIVRRGQRPRTRRALRLALHTDAWSCLLYSATAIEVLDAEALVEHPFLRRLGPDVVAMETAPEAILGQYTDPVFHKRQLGVLLLDQSFLAGLGNYLRSEILFLSRESPYGRPMALDAERLRRLAVTTRQLARRSYEHGGVTNDLETYERLRGRGCTYAAARFYVFGRGGAPCYVCAAPIQRLQVAGRRLYCCPACQELDRRD